MVGLRYQQNNRAQHNSKVQGQPPATPSHATGTHQHPGIQTRTGGNYQGWSFSTRSPSRSTMVVLHQQQNNHEWRLGFIGKRPFPPPPGYAPSTTNLYEINYPYESPSTPSSWNSLLLTEPTTPQPTDWCPVDHNHDIRFWSGWEKTSSKGGDFRRSSKGGL